MAFDKKDLLIGGSLGFFLLAVFFIQGLSFVVNSCLLILGLSVILAALNVILKDVITSMFFFIWALLAVSFLPSCYQMLATGMLLLGACIVLLSDLKKSSEQLGQCWITIRLLPAQDILMWTFLLLLVIPMGLWINKGFFPYDPLHPLYELSIGNSYSISIFHPPDLSYSGKGIKYHFLSTQIPSYLSYVLHVSILDSVYFFTPLLSTLCLAVLIITFFKKQSTLKIPAFILFFLPLYLSVDFEFKSLYVCTAAGMSYVLGVMIIVVAIYCLIQDKRWLLVLSAATLILIKASFFVVLLGGIGLFYLRKMEFRKGFPVVISLSIVFVVLYKTFLSGAHQHNHWIVFPTVLYTAITSFKSYAWLTLVLPLMLAAGSVVVYFKNNKSDVFLAIASVSLSGVLLAALLTEVTEANSVQFLIASYFATVIIFWYWIQKILEKSQGLIGKLLLGLFIAVMAASFISNTYARYILTAKYLLGCAVKRSKIQNDLTRAISQRMKLAEKDLEPQLSSDLISAYSWLREHTEKESVVLFGKHYEKKSLDDNWWPDTMFVRSALSGRQMYCENFKYKGIAMEKDFPLRFARDIHFYKNFVVSSAKSLKGLGIFYQNDNIFETGFLLGFNKKDDKKLDLLKVLHFDSGLTWYYRVREVNESFKSLVDSLPVSKAWLSDFLEIAHIDYVVLENGDKPSKDLENITRTVYRNSSIMILEVEKTASFARLF